VWSNGTNSTLVASCFLLSVAAGKFMNMNLPSELLKL
jgi:hypothetical protein